MWINEIHFIHSFHSLKRYYSPSFIPSLPGSMEDELLVVNSGDVEAVEADADEATFAYPYIEEAPNEVVSPNKGVEFVRNRAGR